MAEPAAGATRGRPAGVRVKICGVTSAADARLAEEAGADYVGFVLSAGFGRSLPESDAPAAAAGTALPRVAVLVDEEPEVAARMASSIEASVLQLHGSEGPEVIEALRRLGDWVIWKAVRARSVEEIGEAVSACAGLVDGFLVEGWKEGVVGGGGATLRLDADAVREAVAGGPDFVLAGGLTPGNVAEAVARFLPDVVDVSSGVEETPGRKDPDRVRAFVRAAKATTTSPS